jgi:hypothetical protein
MVAFAAIVRRLASFPRQLMAILRTPRSEVQVLAAGSFSVFYEFDGVDAMPPNQPGSPFFPWAANVPLTFSNAVWM